jgi:hypothetical protein
MTTAQSDLTFKKYTIDQYNHYSGIYADLLPASDFSPNNIVVWLDIENDLQLAYDQGNVVLGYSCPFIGDGMVYTVVGTDNPTVTADKVFDYQRAHGSVQQLTMVPEDTANLLAKSSTSTYIIEEDTENFDYIFDVKDKADLYKPSSSKFRRTIHHFIKQYGDAVIIRELDVSEPEDLAEITNTLKLWRSENVISNNDKMHVERTAIERYLNYRDILKPKCLAVYIEDELVGFAIYHYPPQAKYAIINHIKCNYKYQNIFDFIFFCIMNHLKMDGIEYANGEQDLGIIGIRNYKHKLGPISYIRRYTITPAGL